jgi:hypothetical protein
VNGERRYSIYQNGHVLARSVSDPIPILQKLLWVSEPAPREAPSCS